MSEGEFKKHFKTGEEIYKYIDSCWDRHCSTCYHMKPEEVPDYEKDLKECNEEKWISSKILERAREDFPWHVLYNLLLVLDIAHRMDSTDKKSLEEWYLKYFGVKNE